MKTIDEDGYVGPDNSNRKNADAYWKCGLFFNVDIKK